MATKKSSASTPDLDFARSLCAFIDRSPSPFHVVATALQALETAGFSPVDLEAAWPGAGKHYVARGGALVAWIDTDADAVTPFTIVGAHTDSPNLRVKPQPDMGRANFRQLGVEIYGGVLLNSWLDRDLGISGRIAVRGSGKKKAEITEQLVLVDRPVARLPQLAIHLDRKANEGLALNKQTHMAPVWGLGAAEDGDFAKFIAAEAGVKADDIVSWDLMLHDTTASALVGNEEEFVSAPRLDNQLSCFIALESLLAANGSDTIPMIAFFDHEEVGSTSATGAGSPLLGSIIERSVAGRGGSADEHHRAVASSLVISSDNAHATHPNYADRHEPDHHITLNAGPVIKINANERYATDATTAARFQVACEQAGVPFQKFVNRTDLGCGSTIGPITAAELGADTVDIGCPQLAMHSARELSGSHDPGYLRDALLQLLG